ncbi:MAG: nicotinate (nicotinamide) nucleotide adenylyltransferase [Flavobacteriales bacterium]
MRIGCLFGTFDPPHNGHLAIAEHMLREHELDQVWLVVTPQNPFKTDLQLSPDQQRLAMVRLAVQGHPGLMASGFEIDLPKPNYTVDSMRFMRHRWPDHRFDLIIGSDNLAAFHKWKDPEEILEYHRLLVYPRSGFKEHLAQSIYHGHPGVRVIADASLLDLSSTTIREDIRAWRPVDDRLSPTVVAYIREHGLYKT